MAHGGSLRHYCLDQASADVGRAWEIPLSKRQIPVSRKNPHESMRTAGLKKDKPNEPPEPLQERTKQGAKRCSYWDRRRTDPKDPSSPLRFFQCGRAARKGWSVCCYHGAGSAKREKQGIRQRPGVANVTMGTTATPASLKAFLTENPSVDDRLVFWRSSSTLFDFRELIALNRAMLEHFAKNANLDITENPNGTATPNLRVITATGTLIENTERMVALEKTIPPVLNADVECFLDCVSIILAEFVPKARLGASRARLTELLQRRQPLAAG